MINNSSGFEFVKSVSGLDHKSLLQVMRPFVEEPEEMVAVGGRLSIVNGCQVRSGQVVDAGTPLGLVGHIGKFRVKERAVLLCGLMGSAANGGEASRLRPGWSGEDNGGAVKAEAMKESGGWVVKA